MVLLASSVRAELGFLPQDSVAWPLEGQGREFTLAAPKQLGNRQTDNKLQPRPDFRPPRRGRPSRRESGATRSASCQATAKVPFTAIVPENNFGLTTSGRPTFFWASGYSQPMELQVIDQTTKAIVWRQVIRAEQPGIVSVQMPADRPELVPDREYRWYITVQCSARQSSANPVISSYIQRIIPPPSLTAQLHQAKPPQQPEIYAAEGIWFETLVSLADLRRAQPNQPDLKADWKSLLELVGLGDLANQPLVKVTLVPTPQVPVIAPPPAQPKLEPQGVRAPEVRTPAIPSPVIPLPPEKPGGGSR